MTADPASSQLLVFCVVLLTVIAVFAAYFSYRMFRLNRQLLISVSGVMENHKKDILELEQAWAQLNADHREVMKFVQKPVAEERPLPPPQEING